MHSRLWLSGMALFAFSLAAIAEEGGSSEYPTMQPVARYMMASPAAEEALARSAAPPSISLDAEVLVFGAQGYVSAAKGKNGFVCLVERAWASDFDDTEFWNPKIRAPMCLNAAAARSILPSYFERTGWALGGASKSEIFARTKAEVLANRLLMPEAGAMSYMMSKEGHLNDRDGHWHPHLMFYLANAESAAWGANLKGSPVFADRGDPEPITTFFIPVPHWSDGAPAEAGAH